MSPHPTWLLTHGVLCVTQPFFLGGSTHRRRGARVSVELRNAFEFSSDNSTFRGDLCGLANGVGLRGCIWACHITPTSLGVLGDTLVPLVSHKSPTRAIYMPPTAIRAIQILREITGDIMGWNLLQDASEMLQNIPISHGDGWLVHPTPPDYHT